MRKKIRNKTVKKYDPEAKPEEYQIGDILYFEKIRDWSNEGNFLEGVYGEVVDKKRTKDNLDIIVVNFADYRDYNKTKQDPGPHTRQFVVGRSLKPTSS